MERSRQSSTKISRHRLKRNGTPDKADQQPADLKQPEYEGHDPGKICFRFKFGHSLYCRFLRRNLPAEAYRHRAAFNRRPYARSRRQSKIEQVLYNLLDNAIKFSHPDSAIRIETNEKHGKVFVSVKDSGIGIPKDSLRLIFDRFYKTDLSRGKDKREPGWDFPLQKEIIQAHNENINVISTEGVGSEFIFSLPVQDNEA